MIGKRFRALGLMSGTSMDGIDAALVETDGARVFALGPARTDPYDGFFRDRLRAALGPVPADADLARDLTERHAASVRRLLADAGLKAPDVDVVGFHGHTVRHEPGRGITRQIGDGEMLARLVGIPVVADFRSRDVAAGGEGAPLAPLYHAARADGLDKPVAILNLGGVANVTWIGVGAAAGDLIAFDTGPGNALLDDWTRATIGRPMDEDGRLARAGRPDAALLGAWLADGYFHRSPPKSLDRDHFAKMLAAVKTLSPADGAATLARFTAEAAALARAHFPAPPRRWLVAGGGRHNGCLMDELGHVLGGIVVPVEAVGWRGDFLEAEAFAFLAVRSRLGLPLSLPATTGVRAPSPGGTLHLPPSGKPPGPMAGPDP
ncbi:MAG: anhydro-N-acetylmuramic acid kinase [Rhodospirillales bacterium]|nr:anhydro-N-acetylmuramic acid kinase [Rhodospirillales bacterium]MSP80343.1 anhydro-N-acetylmuramic acid kinase [Rhodospirillales bacterium]